MSYILNALRKSEQERQESQIETLENRIQHNQNSKPIKTSVWLISLVLVNVFFLLYFLWSFTKNETEDNIKNKVVLVQKELKKAVSEQKQKKEIKEKLADKPSTVLLAAKQQFSIAEQIEKRKILSHVVIKEIKPAKAKIAIPKRIPIAVLKTPVKKQKQSISVSEIVIQPIELEKQTNDFPFLSELDYDFRRKVPDMDINVYVYAEKQQDRFIMVNMKKYLTGQVMESGITLKEIRIDSLLVEYRHRIFQIKRK